MPDTTLVPSLYKIHLNLILFSMMKFTCYAEETFSILCLKKTYENLLNSVMKFTCYAEGTFSILCVKKHMKTLIVR